MKTKIPAKLRAEIELEIRSRKKESKKILSFRQFIQLVHPKYKFYWHIERIITCLQGVADGSVTRLIVVCPPRHGKSELISRLFPAYIQYLKEGCFVGINSYSSDLAVGFSRNAIEFFRRSGGRLTVEASKHWETNKGGGVWAAGVGGPITGKGFNFGIIDDPLKNAQESESPRIREKQWEWYQSTFYTRAEPESAIIVDATRWHEDDLIGKIISEEKDEEQPEHWHIIHFEAIRSEDEFNYPANCTVEEDPREPGEQLCEERYPLARLQKIKRRVGSYFWNALFQGRPGTVAGNIIKREWIKRYTNLPGGSKFYFITLDPTFDDTKDADFVVAVAWCRVGISFYVLDVLRERLSFVDTVHRFSEFCSQYRQATAKLIEKKANGAAILSILGKKIQGLIPFDPGQNSKENRLKAVSPVFEAGNVYVPENAYWVEDWITEHCSFPKARHDDQVDNTSMALLHYGNQQEFNILLDRFR